MDPKAAILCLAESIHTSHPAIAVVLFTLAGSVEAGSLLELARMCRDFSAQELQRLHASEN